MSARTPWRMTLRVGLSTAFVGVVLVTAGVLCAVLVRQMHDQMRRDLTARMRDVASIAAMGIWGAPEFLWTPDKQSQEPPACPSQNAAGSRPNANVMQSFASSEAKISTFCPGSWA